MPLSPLWANLPRRKCDDCGKTYKPVKPLREGERGFCCANCRKSYHKHGGAYRKLRDLTRKMVADEIVGMEKRLRDIVRFELMELVLEMPHDEVGPWLRVLNERQHHEDAAHANRLAATRANR
jgi:hypothetical protein